MIKNLYIKDYIIIRELSLDLNDRMSVFTGETGAGKSIIIDAISLLCGERLNHNVVAKGATKAFIEAIFTVNNKESEQILLDNGFELLEEYSLSREITDDLKSTLKLNGRTITQSLAKELTSHLIDIHDQNGTQYLLNKKNNLKLLDKFISDNTLLDTTKEKYNIYYSKKKELDNALKNDYNADDKDYLEFVKNEIDSINTYETEYDELEDKRRKMMTYEKTSSTLKSVIEELNKATDSAYIANKQLADLKDVDIEKISEKLNSNYYESLDVLEELKDYFNNMSFDEDELNLIESRLFDLNKVRRKYGDFQNMMVKYNEAINKLELIDHREEFILKASKEVQLALNEYNEVANKLSLFRKEKANELVKAIEQELKDLELNKTKFDVCFSEKEPSNNGSDDVEFLISTNPGMPLESMINIASGGELSRIMLALKTIFNKLENIETVIFDEIDSGVSGTVATSIAKKMKFIANSAQVFSVTHLAQVASIANNHYFVYKSSDENSTTSKVKQLDTEERISEIATIMSSSNSETAIKAATELFDTLQNN